MADKVKYKWGTEAQILALTVESASWVNRAFYYPSDKNYFYQAVDGVMRKYGDGDVTAVGVGVTLNDKVMGGVKTRILEDEVLDIPEDYDYNTFRLSVSGVVNCSGQINIM